MNQQLTGSAGSATNTSLFGNITDAGTFAPIDGLSFDSIGNGYLRYRGIGYTNNGTVPAYTSGLIATNGSMYSANAAGIPAAGSQWNSAGQNLRAIISVAIPDGAKAFTIKANWAQNSTNGAAGGQIGFVASNGVVLAVQDTPAGGSGTLVATVPAGHGYTSVKILYARNTLSNGGVNISYIERTQ